MRDCETALVKEVARIWKYVCLLTAVRYTASVKINESKSEQKLMEFTLKEQRSNFSKSNRPTMCHISPPLADQ